MMTIGHTTKSMCGGDEWERCDVISTTARRSPTHPAKLHEIRGSCYLSSGGRAIYLLIVSHLSQSHSSALSKSYFSASPPIHLSFQRLCTLTAQSMRPLLHTPLWHTLADRAPNPASPIYLYTLSIEFLYLHSIRRPLPVNFGQIPRKKGSDDCGGCFEVSEG